ncbi:MAG: hypothetical protein ACJ8M1_13050 [Chthoniobacterales bacterium]
MNSKQQFEGGYSRGPAYNPKEKIPIAQATTPGKNGLVYISPREIAAILAANQIAAQHTAEGPEAAVGVTFDQPSKQIGLTRHYSVGRDTGLGAGDVSIPRLGRGDFKAFIADSHGHHGDKPYSQADFLFSNTHHIPLGMHNSRGDFIYVPRMDAAATTLRQGVIWSY